MFVSQWRYVPMATLMNIYIVRIKMLALRLMTHRYKINRYRNNRTRFLWRLHNAFTRTRNAVDILEYMAATRNTQMHARARR